MIYTAGHSTFSEQVFMKMMYKVDTVLDVRSHPGSTKNPQFNKENMEAYVPTYGPEYRLDRGLGGWDVRHHVLYQDMLDIGININSYLGGHFPKQTIAKNMNDVGDKPKWTNVGLNDYSWFMTLPEFLESADRLIEEGKNKDVCIFCCESLWYKCHRSLISDYLYFRGVESIHLSPRVKMIRGEKKHSDVISNRLLRYDQRIIDIWHNWSPNHVEVMDYTIQKSLDLS